MARLNVQALARKSPELMGCILPEKGHTVVGIDLSAGEPTVVSHYSQDVNYKYACFDGVGKRPYYNADTLMIDDVYLMVASVSPMFKKDIRAAFNDSWPMGTFADQWIADKEVVTKKLKKIRTFAKIGTLGFLYGLYPKNFVTIAYNAGYVVTKEESTAFFKSYWNLYSGVRAFADRKARQVQRDGYLVNEFGYRGVPPESKAFNFFIQSSVSGIMHVYTAKLMAIAPYAYYNTLIHDEVLLDVPTDRLEEFRIATQTATDSLNEDLQWSVAIRTGFAPGHDWYTAK